MRRASYFFALWAALAVPAAGQDIGAARADYFRAVARFFSLPANEVAILSDWEIPADEIPVVLFIARRGGVSPEALVALRGSGRTWSALAERYRVGPAALHVPVPDEATAGRLTTAYAQYRSVPVADWSSIRLSDADIVALVNVRVISQSLGLSAARVLSGTDSAATFVELYAQLKR